MEKTLQHPDVGEAERTGYARGDAPETAFRCDGCGGEIRAGEGYYALCDRRFCRRCVEWRSWREASV